MAEVSTHLEFCVDLLEFRVDLFTQKVNAEFKKVNADFKMRWPFWESPHVLMQMRRCELQTNRLYKLCCSDYLSFVPEEIRLIRSSVVHRQYNLALFNSETEKKKHPGIVFPYFNSRTPSRKLSQAGEMKTDSL
jgi:hypothetical protein